MITLYTHTNNPSRKEFWKHVTKQLLGRYSGPDAVCDSLRRGLRELGTAYELNPLRPHYRTMLVLSGTDALKEAIKRKEAGHITKLLAGPNLVTTPQEAGGILCDDSIDRVLVPSQWVADAYTTFAPELSGRIAVWPAGVADAPPSTRERRVIIFDKINDATLCNEAMSAIQSVDHTPVTLKYGAYKQTEYFTELARTNAVVYLSPSESQGLALQEAWIRDVPTFVYKTGTARMGNRQWTAGNVNAPYLTNDFGALYTTKTELIELLHHADTYHPQSGCRETLSDTASARKLLNIIDSIEVC